MEPGLARVFIFPFIKKQLIISVKELLMSLFTLAEKWLQDTPQRTYSECIHKPARALGTTTTCGGRGSAFGFLPFRLFASLFVFPPPPVLSCRSARKPADLEQVGVYVPGLPPDLCKGHSDRVTLPVSGMGRKAGGYDQSAAHPGSQDLLPKSSGVGDAHAFHCTLCCGSPSVAWAVLAALSSSEQHPAHPEEATQVLSQQHTWGYILSPAEKRLALMFPSASDFSMASGCWLGVCAFLYMANFGIPQYWKIVSWQDFRPPFDVTVFQCGLTHNQTAQCYQRITEQTRQRAHLSSPEMIVRLLLMSSGCFQQTWMSVSGLYI